MTGNGRASAEFGERLFRRLAPTVKAGVNRSKRNIPMGYNSFAGIRSNCVLALGGSSEEELPACASFIIFRCAR